MCTFAEWVLPGHPDKLSDRIADALVDAAVALDPDALAGIEVAVHRDHVFVDGRIAAPGAEGIAFNEIVRRVFTGSGYNDVFAPNPASLVIQDDLCLGDFRPDERTIRRIADDQNIVTGYAEHSREPHCLPIPHFVAFVLAKHLEEARLREADRFGPDGKVLVVTESEWDADRKQLVHAIEAVSVSIHHHDRTGTVDVFDIAKQVLERATRYLDDMPGGHLHLDRAPKLMVNGAGDFAVGGPMGDNGLSGKKLVVDAYGPHVPIGGGALSGKDPHKIDRAMALRARQIAKHLVIAGVAERALVHLAFAPGDEAPRWTEIQFGRLDGANGSIAWSPAEPRFTARWLSGYDLSIEGTFRDLGLQNIRWEPLAAWGHFTDPTLPWERWQPGAITR